MSITQHRRRRAPAASAAVAATIVVLTAADCSGQSGAVDLIINVSGPCERMAADRAELEQGDMGEQTLDTGGTHPNQQDAVP